VEIRASAFTAVKPAQKPTYASVALPNGDSAVYDLSAVREDPAASDIKEDDLRVRWRRAWLRARRRAMPRLRARMPRWRSIRRRSISWRSSCTSFPTGTYPYWVRAATG